MIRFMTWSDFEYVQKGVSNASRGTYPEKDECRDRLDVKRLRDILLSLGLNLSRSKLRTHTHTAIQ